MLLFREIGEVWSELWRRVVDHLPLSTGWTSWTPLFFYGSWPVCQYLPPPPPRHLPRVTKQPWLRLAKATFNGWDGFFPPTRVSSPGTERLLAPIEPSSLADPSRRSSVDKYSLQKKNPRRQDSFNGGTNTERSRVKIQTVDPRVPFDALLKEPFNVQVWVWTGR